MNKLDRPILPGIVFQDLTADGNLSETNGQTIPQLVEKLDWPTDPQAPIKKDQFTLNDLAAMLGISLSELETKLQKDFRTDARWNERITKKIIGDRDVIWLLPPIGNSCMSADVVVPWERCSGKFLGRDSEGNDRWSGPILIKGKLIPDKRSTAAVSNPDGLFGTGDSKNEAEKSTCELPIYSGNERSTKGKTFLKVPSTGEWVKACERGCEQSFRNNVCFHGIAFTEHCTDECAECRTPHRSRPEKNKLRGSAWKDQHKKSWYAGCKSPLQVLIEMYPSELARWETKLIKEPWSESELRGQNQGLLREHDDNFRPTIKEPVYVDFNGNPIADSQHWDAKFISGNQSDDAVSVGEHANENTAGTDRQYFDLGLTLKTVKYGSRDVPFWVQDFDFIQQLISYMYPRVETQSDKRKFASKLINLYWVQFRELNDVCKELELTENGLSQRLTRIRKAAQELYETRNAK